jgi:hypothetical protein
MSSKFLKASQRVGIGPDKLQCERSLVWQQTQKQLFSSKINSSWSTNGMPLSRMFLILYKLMNENSSDFEGYLETEIENCSWTKPLLENEFASQIRWVLETTSITYIISKSNWLSFMESSGTYIWMRFVRCWAISSGSDPRSWGFPDKFLWPFMNGEGRVVHELD